MRYARATLLFIISLVIFFVLNSRLGMMPPMGKFLNPFAGFWCNNTATDILPRVIMAPQLVDSVVVVWDDRRVPHIFAQNEYDLYFAQGYFTARDRLWQMEFQVDAIAGRLAEIIGEQMLPSDRFFRRCGIVYAAENALKEILANSETRQVLEAYTNGVNAFISNTNERNLPLEYKLLDYKPKPWTFLKTALFLKFMAWNLSAFDISELALTRARLALGEPDAERIYPTIPPFTDPVIPHRTPWRFHPSAIPDRPTLPFEPTVDTESEIPQTTPVKGSNNWAVAPSNTSTGTTLLANDMHLPLYLPHIWYEIQLSTPDMSVYGVSFPGAPMVIVGFNSHIAWGATTAMTDVIDWYEIEFKDETRSHYLHDSLWVPARKRIEEIRVRHKGVVVDTVVYTQHGPIVYHRDEKAYDQRVPTGTAMRWTGHDPSNEILVFAKLNKANNYDDYVEAFSHFDCPPHNFAFASIEGDIAIWHTGKFPIRWQGLGRYINDGRNSAYDWQGWIPKDQVPHVFNPRRGFVSSANQYPVGERYPYYLGGIFWSFDRGARINEALSDMEQITVENMIALQNDVLDISARKILPFLLDNIDETKLFYQERASYDKLRSWNYEFHADQIAPTIYEYWWQELSQMIWADELETPYGNMRMPRRDVTIKLILDNPTSEYFNEKATPARESLKDIIVKSFHSANNRLFDDFGSLGDSWQWGKSKPVNIGHISLVRGLGRVGLPKGGNMHTLNYKDTSFGPSWRMVVSLGKRVKGWGIYPGGQSGHPGSAFYDNFVDDWVAGNMSELLFLQSPEDRDERIIGRTVMRTAR